MLCEWELTSVCDKFYIFSHQMPEIFLWMNFDSCIIDYYGMSDDSNASAVVFFDDWFYPDIILFAWLLSNIILKMIFSSIYLVLNELLLIKSRRWWITKYYWLRTKIEN